jgi:nucleotide-binding universal stress UspA family protein
MSIANVRRILVALDASPHSHAALEAAAALAAPLEAELAGVFVLDAELLRLSALPVARETGLTSAQRRTLDPKSMERALRLQAEQARKSLEHTARQHRLEATFQLVRGNVLAELLRAAQETDLLAMGLMGQMNVNPTRLGSTVRGITSQATCSVLLLSPGVQKGNAVFAVYGRSPNAGSALAIAAQLATQRNAPLVVLVCASEEAAAVLREAAEAQLAQTRQTPKDQAQTQTRVIDPGGFDHLKALLKELDAGLLVMASDSELIDGHQDQLATLDVPVLLAR